MGFKVKNLKFTRKGFTLLEVLIYSAILAISTGAIGTMVYMTSKASLKTQVQNELNNEMYFLEETFRQKIEVSKGVNTISGSLLELEMADSAKNPTQFTLSTSTIYIQEGSGEQLKLNDPTKVKVTALAFSPTGPENLAIASTDHYAWNDQVGWIDFAYPGGNVKAPSRAGDFTGLAYILSDQSWIALNCLSTETCAVNYKVSSDLNGDLSGWAWSENYGWISFNCSTDESCLSFTYGVTMDSNTGELGGYAYSENIGWISFNCNTGGVGGTDICDSYPPGYKVQNLRLRTIAVKIDVTLQYNSPKSELSVPRTRTFVFNIITPTK